MAKTKEEQRQHQTAYRRAYYLANREHMNAKQAEYYRKNRERIKAQYYANQNGDVPKMKSYKPHKPRGKYYIPKPKLPLVNNLGMTPEEYRKHVSDAFDRVNERLMQRRCMFSVGE